jgi:hypothetical protein
MASGAVVRKVQKRAVAAPKAARKVVEAKRTYSPEDLAEHEAVMARVREEGAKRIRASVEKLIALGIVDKDGNRIKKELPADMRPGADREFAMGGAQIRQRDLSDISGSWKRETAFERAVAAQDTVDEEMWRCCRKRA